MGPVSTTAYAKNYRLALICIALLCAIVFFNVTRGDFIFLDDPELVESNLAVHNFDVIEMFSRAQSLLYHPLTTLSWAIDYQIAGLNSGWFHFTNLFLHLINFFLVSTLLILLFPNHLTASIIAAFLFAIHPTRVESVAWIAERKDVLYAAFYLGASIAYLRYLDRHQAKYYITTLILFILSLLSKPMAVSFPVILFLFDYLKHRGFTKNAVLEKLPFLFLSALLTGLIIYIQLSSSAGADIISVGGQISSSAQALLLAISKSFLPYNLSFAYDGYTFSLTLMDYLINIGMIAVLALVVLKQTTLARETIFGILFFLITLSPTLRIISYGDGSLFNDRQLYIPALGIFILIGLAIEYIIGFLKPHCLTAKIITIILAACLLSLSWSTFNRVNTFTKTETIWFDALSKYPGSARSHAMLGAYYFKIQNFQFAWREYNRAYEIEPNAPLYIAHLSQCLIELKKKDEATELLKTSLSRLPNDIILLNAYAARLLDNGDSKTAKEIFEKVVTIKSNHPQSLTLAIDAKAYSYLGLIASQNQDFEQTAFYFQKAVELAPSDAQSRYNLGLAYFYLAKYDEATVELHKSITINPLLIDAQLQLAEILRIKKQYPEAKTQLNIIRQLFPENHLVFCYFGALYHATEEFDKAINSFNQCLSVDPKIPWAYMHLGEIYLAQGDQQQAYYNLTIADRLGYKVQPEILQDLKTSIYGKDSNQPQQ